MRSRIAAPLSSWSLFILVGGWSRWSAVVRMEASREHFQVAETLAVDIELRSVSELWIKRLAANCEDSIARMSDRKQLVQAKDEWLFLCDVGDAQPDQPRSRVLNGLHQCFKWEIGAQHARLPADASQNQLRHRNRDCVIVCGRRGTDRKGRFAARLWCRVSQLVEALHADFASASFLVDGHVAAAPTFADRVKCRRHRLVEDRCQVVTGEQ